MTLEHNTPSPSALNMLLRRIAAFVYDCMLLVAIFFIVTAAALPLNEGEALEHWSFKIFLLLIAFLFFHWCWVRGGQTLGMRAWRIRMIAMNEQPLTFRHTSQHFFLGLALFGISLFYMFFNNDRLALHDKLSKTKIIKQNKDL